LRNSYPGLYNSTPVKKWQVAAAIVAPVCAPGVPEETVAIIALNRNRMKIMGQVTVALPEGRAAIVLRQGNEHLTIFNQRMFCSINGVDPRKA